MAISVFDTPRFLYISAATTLTVIIGKPSAKYSVGTQNAGWARRAGRGGTEAGSVVGAAVGVVLLCMSPDRMELTGGKESKNSSVGCPRITAITPPRPHVPVQARGRFWASKQGLRGIRRASDDEIVVVRSFACCLKPLGSPLRAAPPLDLGTGAKPHDRNGVH